MTEGAIEKYILCVRAPKPQPHPAPSEIENYICVNNNIIKIFLFTLTPNEK